MRGEEEWKEGRKGRKKVEWKEKKVVTCNLKEERWGHVWLQGDWCKRCSHFEISVVKNLIFMNFSLV